MGRRETPRWSAVLRYSLLALCLTGCEAEQLVLEATGAVVAPRPIVQRVADELSRIRRAYGEVRNVQSRASWEPHTLLMGFDAQGWAAIGNGTYHAWDDLNGFLGVKKIESIGDDLIVLTFGRAYNTPIVAQEYATLPNVRYAEPNYTVGDGDDVCLSIAGETHFFIFDEGDGDCLAGCIEHTYRGFTVDGAGRVEALGAWNPDDGAPAPQWFAALADCRRWL